MRKGLISAINNNKRMVAALLSVAMASTALCGCNEEEEVQQEQIVDVETVNPSYDNISVDSSFIGTVETGDIVSVFPKISAQVLEKYYEVGDYVNAGDLLFVLDDKALQIEKRNADASVKSAAATLDAQRANSAAAQAAANESVGTIATTEYERAKAINEADREAGAARINENKNREQAAISNGEANRAREERDDANDQLERAEKFKRHLEKIKEEYINIAKNESQDKADEYITQNTKYLDYEDFSAALEAAKTLVETASTEKSAQQGNYTSSLSQKIEACANAEIERGTISNAEEAKALAQKMFLDFELFTKNTILAEANARVVEGQANVAASDSQLESAKALQDLANLNLTYTNVTAPISGVINEINIEKFGMATDQNAAYVITGQNNKKISFYVPENILRNIEIGQSVTIEKDKRLFGAVVTRKNDSLKGGETMFKVEAAIANIEDADFILGTKLKVKTSVEKQENVLTVPIGALYYDDGKPYLFVAMDGKAVRMDVETGIADDSKIQIISGLEGNANVITSWSSSLKDQTDIKVVNSNMVKNDEKPVKDDIKEAAKPEVINIAREDNTAESDGAETAAVMVETTDKVNIRRLPDKSSDKLDTVKPGTQFVKIEDTDNGWTKIKYNSEEAFIKSDYIKLVY